jgi:Protein of unknown function (DUF2950)
MERVKSSFHETSWNTLTRFAAVALLLGGTLALRCNAQQQGQKTFSSPEEACRALYAATKANDEKALLELFGPDGKEVVNSGDPAEDAQHRQHFVQRYQEMSRLVKEPDGTVTIYIGARNWPYPVPIVNKGGVWFFDTATGKQEILYRRVGFNEASAIRICEELAAAQKEYYAKQNHVYASKIYSDSGKQDGLYWKAENGAPESPIGPLVAQAVVDNPSGTTVPFRGYYFHILTKQGKNGPGGAKDYVTGGKMTGGFAFVAFPAAYRVSGVMTFIVGDDGVVYERDLGKDTGKLARDMTEFNPDSHWARAQEGQDQTTTAGAATK